MRRLRTTIAFVLLLPAVFLLLQGCASSTSTKSPSPKDDAKTYSELERAIGIEAERWYRTEFRVDDDPAGIVRLRTLARRLTPVTERSKIDYSFLILDTKERNAISLPNGRILFTRGYLEWLDDDELTAVIAHEFAHVNLRHCMEALKRGEATLWRRIFVSGTVGLIPLAGQKLGYLLLDQGYDQSHEIEADLLGTEYLMRAGLDPNAMTRELEKATRDPELRHAGGILTTHPTFSTRAARVREHIVSLQSSATGASASANSKE